MLNFYTILKKKCCRLQSIHVNSELLVVAASERLGICGFATFQLAPVLSILKGPRKTDREQTYSNWLRRVIIEIFYCPQSHLAQTLTL